MWPFSRKNEIEETTSSKFFDFLNNAFSGLKTNQDQMQNWLNYLNNRDFQQETRLQKIELYLSTIPKSDKELKQFIYQQQQYNQYLVMRINELNEQLAKIELKEPRRESKENIKERLVKKITKNSKDYVKSTVLSLIRKYERISASQLREIVVDEQGLCSKSSFYRILEEIEKNEEIEAVKEGKEKSYLSKILRRA